MNPGYIPRTARTLITAMLVIAVVGCVSKDMTNLENYSAEVLSRKGGRIEPLPPIKPYERYLYQAGTLALRDPFRSFLGKRAETQDVAKIDDPNQKAMQGEIALHNSEKLESFALDSLRMVGVLENVEAMWGIVRDTDGVVHRVQVGNCVGTNFGKIINIQDDRIDLRELIQDSQGLWEERVATLALTDE